jgi:hypothetical protein
MNTEIAAKENEEALRKLRSNFDVDMTAQLGDVDAELSRAEDSLLQEMTAVNANHQEALKSRGISTPVTSPTLVVKLLVSCCCLSLAVVNFLLLFISCC